MISAQPALFSTDARTATFSRSRIYRYELWRRWSQGTRYVNFICLNPSTADESTDDPTVRKCVKFARTWGYDALCITNLFAYRVTDRSVIKQVADPVGLGNDRHILSVASKAALVVCAWSTDGAFMGRGSIVRRMIARFDPHYLRLTREQPWHPLYLPDATIPSRWHSREFLASLNKKENQ